jgi:hypothetical protein
MRHLGAVLVLAACGATPPPSPMPAPCPVALRPGTLSADGGFELIDEGHPLEIAFGPQGGFHVFVGLEADGLDRTGTLEWALRADRGQVLATRSLALDGLVLEDTPCGWRRRRDLLIFESNDDVPGARDVPATLRVGVQGRALERTVVPR